MFLNTGKTIEQIREKVKEEKWKEAHTLALQLDEWFNRRDTHFPYSIQTIQLGQLILLMLNYLSRVDNN